MIQIMNREETALNPPESLGNHAWIWVAALAVHGLLLWALNVGLSKGPAEVEAERHGRHDSLELWAPWPAVTPSPVSGPAKTQSMHVAKPVRPNPVRPNPPKPDNQVPPKPTPVQPSLQVDALAVIPAIGGSNTTTPDSSPVAASTPITSTAPPAGGVAPSGTRGPTSATVQSQPVRVLHGPKPAYPGLSRRLAEEGTVWLRIDVMANGQVARIDVIRSSGHRRLDQAALEQLKAWRFSPALQAGQATAASLEVPVAFKLNVD